MHTEHMGDLKLHENFGNRVREDQAAVQQIMEEEASSASETDVSHMSTRVRRKPSRARPSGPGRRPSRARAGYAQLDESHPEEADTDATGSEGAPPPAERRRSSVNPSHRQSQMSQSRRSSSYRSSILPGRRPKPRQSEISIRDGTGPPYRRRSSLKMWESFSRRKSSVLESLSRRNSAVLGREDRRGSES